MRNHGLERPWHPLQVGAWVLFAYFVVGYYALLFPMVHGLVHIIITAAHAILAVATFALAIITSRIDPADINVKKKQSATCPKYEEENPADATADGSGSDRVYCFKCSVYVHGNSCHCRQCDKCVESYDHHCKWLNNCIGKNNYKPFLATLAVVLAFSLLQLGLCIYIETMFFLQPSTIKAAVAQYAPVLPFRAYGALVFVLSFWLFAVAVVVGHLLAFHLMLMHQHVTTYEYLVRQLKRQEEGKTKAKTAEKPQDQLEAPVHIAPTFSSAASSGAKGVSGFSSSKIAVGWNINTATTKPPPRNYSDRWLFSNIQSPVKAATVPLDTKNGQEEVP